MIRPIYATRGPDAGVASEQAIDLVFAISGTRLPADYALALWEALVARLPWLAGEPGVGVHAIRASAGEGGLLLSRVITDPKRSDAMLRAVRNGLLALKEEGPAAQA